MIHVTMSSNKPNKIRHVNVAKGTKIETTEDFCNKYSTLSVEQKMAVIKNLDKAIETGLSPNNIRVSPGQMNATKQLRAWCQVNLLVGEELCPASSLNNY